MRFNNIIGKEFGRLRVEDFFDRKNNKIRWKCKCSCGNYAIVSTSNLNNGNTKSCGCLQRERSSISKLKDIIGCRFGKLVVKERLPDNKLLCLCDCGKTVAVVAGNLTSGNSKSCGCLSRENASKNMIIDISGKTFGCLTVVKRVSKQGEKTVKWLCKCTCGMYTIVASYKLRTGHTSSCGHLRNSKPESIIVHYLNACKIKYEKEFMFKDLLSEKGYPLRFDFKINYPRGFFLLEYQGQQHYYNSNDKFGLMQREVTDKAKIKYCQDNNIELTEIRYNEDVVEALEKILNDHNLLQGNLVPSSGQEKV